jgi:hypothetical protein
MVAARNLPRTWVLFAIRTRHARSGRARTRPGPPTGAKLQFKAAKDRCIQVNRVNDEGISL